MAVAFDGRYDIMCLSKVQIHFRAVLVYGALIPQKGRLGQMPDVFTALLQVLYICIPNCEGFLEMFSWEP